MVGGGSNKLPLLVRQIWEFGDLQLQGGATPGEGGGPPGCKEQLQQQHQVLASKSQCKQSAEPTGREGGQSIYEETTAVNPAPQPRLPPARHQRPKRDHHIFKTGMF